MIFLNIILVLSLLIGVGFIFGKLAQLIKLPSVSGYLIAGLLISILPINLTGHTEVFNMISQITLSFIAFGIGSEFKISELKKNGKKILLITIFEVIGAILIVFLFMFFFSPLILPEFTFEQRLSFSLVLGSMSAATAPAATIMVIKQFRAKGPLTKTILPVTALDDILGILAFGIVLPIAVMLTPMDGSGSSFDLLNAFTSPLIEVFGSLLGGLALGMVLSIFSRRDDARDELQVKTILIILIGLGLSFALGLNSLLINIMVGATLANLRPHAERSFRSINDFVPVFYILFFAIAGATIDLSILTTVGILGIIYVIARAIGKISGAYIGATAGKAEPAIRKYLGIALLPQGGISIGLNILVMASLPTNIATPIVTIILFSIIIYESLGPVFAKLSLSKAGELYKAETLLENDEF